MVCSISPRGVGGYSTRACSASAQQSICPGGGDVMTVTFVSALECSVFANNYMAGGMNAIGASNCTVGAFCFFTNVSDPLFVKLDGFQVAAVEMHGLYAGSVGFDSAASCNASAIATTNYYTSPTCSGAVMLIAQTGSCDSPPPAVSVPLLPNMTALYASFQGC